MLSSLCLFSHVYSHVFFLFFCCFVYVVYVRPADIHVGEPGPGVRGAEGGAGPLAAARTGGSGQCGLCRSGAGGDVHLPLATGALRVSVRPARLVQHRGGARQRPRRPGASEQTTGKSAEHQLLIIVGFAVRNVCAHRATLRYATFLIYYVCLLGFDCSFEAQQVKVLNYIDIRKKRLHLFDCVLLRFNV